MNRGNVYDVIDRATTPHASGDEPTLTITSGVNGTNSPREWG